MVGLLQLMDTMLVFFFSTYAVTWSLWLAASMTTSAPARTLLFLLGTFAPGFVALALTYRAAGRRGVVTLLERLVAWDVPLRWYIFAISYIGVVKLSVAVIHRGLLGTWPPFGDTPFYLMLAAAIGSTLVGGQAGEELGWRGYALPRLTRRWGLAGASLILGIVWAVWHLPLFFVPEATTFGQSFPLYLLQVMSLSVAMAWLYARTGGSLLPVMLLHAAVNNTKDIVPSAELNATNPWALSQSPVAWLTLLLLWVCAGYFLYEIRKAPERSREVAGWSPDPDVNAPGPSRGSV